MKRDQIRIGPEIGPGVRTAVMRDVEGDHAVLMTQVRDGVPIPDGSEIVEIDTTCREGWHDVISRSGPVQVATPAYREGYDRIFGKRVEVGQA